MDHSPASAPSRLPRRLLFGSILVAIAPWSCSYEAGGKAEDQNITIAGEDPSPVAEAETFAALGKAVSEPASAVSPAALAEIEYGDRFPEVLDVKTTPAGDGRWRFSVTLSSEYDSPKRYADAWRVLDADDRELGVRVLGHDHAGEQPFTRSHTVDVPLETRMVFIEGRDQENGWSGQRFEFRLP